MVRSTRKTLWFDLFGGVYVGRFGAKSTLIHDEEENEFVYYDGTGDFGNLGDLKRVRIQAWEDAAWEDTAIHYYRYYQDEEEHGFEHGLKFVVRPAAYARMTEDSLDPLSVSNAVLSQYADQYISTPSPNRSSTAMTMVPARSRPVSPL